MRNELLRLYVAAWSSACALAVWLLWREWRAYAVAQAVYLRFLLVPWKLVTFALAMASFVVAAPYTGDPTWDRADACFMSVLTYATAPWSIGALYRVARGQLPKRQAFVASCAWLLSAGWSYDLYILLRDGVYPASWSANLVASSVLYWSAGLMWNLEWREGRGTIFAFMAEEWPPTVPSRGTRQLAAFVLAFAILVVSMMVPFFLPTTR